MTRTTAQAFDYFLANAVNPTAAQQADVTGKRQATEGYLRSAFPLSSDLPLKRMILIGSADRGTLIRPVDDVDVMAEFTNKDGVFEKYRHDSGAFLQRIRTALNAQTSIKEIGARGQAVRLFYTNGAHVDIAPVFKWSGAGYALPSGSGSWITTDPEEQATWFSGRRQAVGANLTPVVKLSKRWNNVHSKRFKSYHLEVMVSSMFSSVGANYRDAMKCFFDWGSNRMSVNDPAGHSGSLDDYLTYAVREAAKSRFTEALDRANRALTAEAQGDHEEAKRLWQIEMGDGFSTA
jgi:hypothetical protein